MSYSKSLKLKVSFSIFNYSSTTGLIVFESDGLGWNFGDFKSFQTRFIYIIETCDTHGFLIKLLGPNGVGSRVKEEGVVTLVNEHTSKSFDDSFRVFKFAGLFHLSIGSSLVPATTDNPFHGGSRIVSDYAANRFMTKFG